MKNKILIILTLITLIIGCHLDATYKMSGYVYSINGNEITIEDKTGNLYAYYGDTDSLFIGQACVVKFNHKGTESDRTDDTIVSVKY